MTQVVCC